MNDPLFDDLQRSLAAEGPAAAIDRLCASLRERKDYGALFYALLLKARHELGLSPVPTGPSQDIPEAVQGPYEDAIRAAGREVGRLFLDEGNIPQAWAYFRMLGESGPVAEALDQVQPEEGEDVQQLIEIAYHHGVNPRRGFDLLLERFGICSAITAANSADPNQPAEVRRHCTNRLVRALYEELKSRLAAEVVQQEGTAPPDQSVRGLMTGRDWLFGDDFYHVDMSHLSSVVQMSLHLPPGPELEMARELCEYGQKLSPRFQYPGEPPFEDQYKDYGVYLAILAGDHVEQGLAHFRAKAEAADPESVGTGPAEVLVNLLLRLDRPAEALAVARKHLAAEDGRRLSCPGITELCQKANDYRTLAEVAREQGDSVHFLAGMLAGKK